MAGTVSGGGTIGPGATVLWLKRLDGPTPAPRPSRRPRVVNQTGKMFSPHVLAIAVGESVAFLNDDPYFHNVFSLSPGHRFDAGLYESGRSYVKTFTKPGPVELLCNIHASMINLRRRFRLLHSATSGRCFRHPQRFARAVRAQRVARIVRERHQADREGRTDRHRRIGGADPRRPRADRHRSRQVRANPGRCSSVTDMLPQRTSTKRVVLGLGIAAVVLATPYFGDRAMTQTRQRRVDEEAERRAREAAERTRTGCAAADRGGGVDDEQRRREPAVPGGAARTGGQEDVR